jgi:hypothetical protein
MNAFLQAVENLSRRKVTPSWFRWREWSAMAPAIRNRSFFSATVTSARVLNKMRNMLLDWQADATEEIVDVNTGEIVTAYKETGLAKFRERSAEFLIQEGLATPADYKDTKITNVISNARLQLIYNTNLEQASTFAQWQGRMRNEDWLNLNPAARFVRRPGARIKRQRHVEAEGDVRRWDDFAYWQFQNAADIGGFDVPWGPFGFNSYMIQEPVKRAEAERRKLVRKGERVKAPNVAQFGVDLGKQFNAGVDANIDDLTPELANEARKTITDRLGPQAIGRDGKPTLDALKQALSGNYKPIQAPQAPAVNAPSINQSRSFEQLTRKLVEVESGAYKKANEDYQSANKAKKEAFQAYINTPLKGEEYELAYRQFQNAKAEELRLFAEYQKAVETAREAVSIPQQERGLMTTGSDPYRLSIEKNVKDGYEIVQRYTNKDYLVKINIDLNSDDRAFHRGGTIYIKKTTDASVVAHEVTHATEQQNISLLRMARDFLLKRSNGEKAQKLSKLTGNKRYKANEIAYKDKWVDRGGDAYSGKDYGDRATEILTMGIERLHEDPVKFYRSDPEYFEFVVKTLQNIS